MEQIPVTAYSGFSKVRGKINLGRVIGNIRNGVHAQNVFKVRMLVSQGKTEAANNVKRQLPFYTVTATYREKRLAYSMTGYNHVILLDIDDLPEDRLDGVRKKINGDTNTLASFLTPKGHGFKVFVFLKTEYAIRLRKRLTEKLEETGKVEFALLEKHHLEMYNECKRYYEELLEVKVDASGKDISRGFFTSYDNKAYLNEELMKEVDETVTNIVLPEESTEKKKGKTTGAKAAKGNEAIKEKETAERRKEQKGLKEEKAGKETKEQKTSTVEIFITCYSVM